MFQDWDGLLSLLYTWVPRPADCWEQQNPTLLIPFWAAAPSWKTWLTAAAAEGGMREQEAVATAYREGSHRNSSHHLPSPTSPEATRASAEGICAFAFRCMHCLGTQLGEISVSLWMVIERGCLLLLKRWSCKYHRGILVGVLGEKSSQLTSAF